MPGAAPGHRRVRLLLAAYRWLVFPLHPRDLRRDFGGEILDEAEGSLRRAAAENRSVVRAWLGVIADVRSARRLSRHPSAAAASSAPAQPLPRGERLAGTLRQDLHYALRSFRRRPGFLIAAVLILAVAIGATTLVFSITNAYLLRGLPFPEPERLARVGSFPVDGDFRDYRQVLEELDSVDWPTRDNVVEHVGAWDLDGFTILNGERAEAVPGSWVTPGYFGALGITPALGRTFRADEAGAARRSVAVISHRLWQGFFNGDAEILGRTFTAYSTDRPDEAETFSIIGVLAEDFWYFNRFTDVLVPLAGRRVPSLVRLQPGVGYEQAAAHLTAIAAAVVDTSSAPDWRMEVVPALESHVRQVRPALVVLTGVVALVLLIACGNLAVLLLVRAVDREHEISLRRSLGASPGRIFRQLFTEGLVLAAAAGGAGVLAALAALDALAPVVQQQLGTGVPGGAAGIRLDARVLMVALVATGVTGLIFGLVPALCTRRTRLAGLLRDGARGGSDSLRRHSARNLLIGGEVALSLALLLGAGLMARSAVHLNGLELGFEPDRLLKANISMREASYPHPNLRRQFVERVLAGARALPEVESLSLVNPYPFRVGSAGGDLVVGDGGAPEDVEAAVQIAGPGYPETMGMPLLQGRWFTAADTDEAAPVAVISDTLAERLWPGRSPIGRQVRAAAMMQPIEEAPWRTVVGVVGPVRKSLTEPPVPDLYISYDDTATTFFFLMVRTSGDPMRVAAGLQRVVTAIDPEQPLGDVGPMLEVVSAAGAQPRFLASLLGGFSLFAASLALFGLYAVVSYAVAQRQRDVAVRMAVGAQGADVVRLFLRQGMFVVAGGMAAGLLVSQWVIGGLESQLFGVASLDLPTYAAVLAALAVASLLAVYVPARRAAACDPMKILRRE